MLSRHFRAQNLNVSEMRLLFLCDARIQESLSEGVRGGGGGGPTAEKQPQQRFFKPSTDFTVIHGGSNIFQGGGGVQHFQGGGGGVQMLISIKTHITCDFPEGVLTPCPPSGSAHV